MKKAVVVLLFIVSLSAHAAVDNGTGRVVKIIPEWNGAGFIFQTTNRPKQCGKLYYAISRTHPLFELTHKHVMTSLVMGRALRIISSGCNSSGRALITSVYLH